MVSTPGNPRSYEHVVETNEWLRYMVEKHDLPTLRYGTLRVDGDGDGDNIVELNYVERLLPGFDL